MERERSPKVVVLLAAVLTAAWWLVVLPPTWSGAVPFSWRGIDMPGCVRIHHVRYGLLALDLAIWFVGFYGVVRGLFLMRRSAFREPFDRRAAIRVRLIGGRGV